MEPKQFRLEGQSLSEVTERVRALYGPDARIVSAERVTVGGVKGFFAKQHYEVTVEEQGQRGAVVGGSGMAGADLTRRLGIAALLDDADDVEERIQHLPVAPKLSTASADFDAIMADLSTATGLGPEIDLLAAYAKPQPALSTAELTGGPAAARDALGIGGADAARQVPGPLTGAGDLVVIAGLRDDALGVARSMAASCNGLVRRGGMLAADQAGSVSDQIGSVSDRRSALDARAAGVENGATVFVAWGVPVGGSASMPGTVSPRVADLAADQVWVAVDAGRKPADTARWVGAIAANVEIGAVAAIGAAETQSPETLRLLDLPIGWIDGVPVAQSSVAVG